MPTRAKTSASRRTRKRPVVAARQASSCLFCPIRLESRALRPTAVPTPTAIIRNCTGYTSVVAVSACSE